MSNVKCIQSSQVNDDLSENELDANTNNVLIEVSENSNAEHTFSENENMKKMLPKPVFRSYKPQSSDLKDNILPDADPLDLEIEESIKFDLMEVNESQAGRLDLQPRKLDWDLKRNIDDRLKYLHRRTRNAIVEIVRKRHQYQNNCS